MRCEWLIFRDLPFCLWFSGSVAIGRGGRLGGTLAFASSVAIWVEYPRHAGKVSARTGSGGRQTVVVCVQRQHRLPSGPMTCFPSSPERNDTTGRTHVKNPIQRLPYWERNRRSRSFDASGATENLPRPRDHTLEHAAHDCTAHTCPAQASRYTICIRLGP